MPPVGWQSIVMPMSVCVTVPFMPCLWYERLYRCPSPYQNEWWEWVWLSELKTIPQILTSQRRELDNYCERVVMVIEWVAAASSHIPSVFMQFYIVRTHPFNGPLSGSTQVSQYQKGKTDLDFTGARDNEWQWHQLGDMQVCISLQTDNHASTSLLKFFTGRMPFLPPNQQCQSTEGTKAQFYIVQCQQYAHRGQSLRSVTALLSWGSSFMCETCTDSRQVVFVVWSRHPGLIVLDGSRAERPTEGTRRRSATSCSCCRICLYPLLCQISPLLGVQCNIKQ